MGERAKYNGLVIGEPCVTFIQLGLDRGFPIFHNHPFRPLTRLLLKRDDIRVSHAISPGPYYEICGAPEKSKEYFSTVLSYKTNDALSPMEYVVSLENYGDVADQFDENDWGLEKIVDPADKSSRSTSDPLNGWALGVKEQDVLFRELPQR